MKKLLRALEFAADRHTGQLRKGRKGTPYIHHPIAVARVLATEGDVTDEDLLAAALLHDTVEDTKTTLEEIEEKFGKAVAGIVQEVTDDKSLRKDVRKRLQKERAPRLSPEAKQLRIADKICNVREMKADPPADWSADRRAEYLEWTERVVKGCRGVNRALEKAYDETRRKARQTLETRS